MKAIWKDTVIAQSENTIIVENNHYFPPDSVRREYLRPSQRHSVCPWKGTASYYDVVVAGDAAHSTEAEHQFQASRTPSERSDAFASAMLT